MDVTQYPLVARKLPIGIQDFASLRRDGYLYVDKTAFVWQLAHQGKQYFLSRPRRFGKSLLLSTMRSYWEGERDLFEGLAIERLEEGSPDAWRPHQVFYFDFNVGNYLNRELESVLDAHLKGWEALYGCPDAGAPLGVRFQSLLRLANEQTGHRCVVLVDEYDKPLLEVMQDPDLLEHNKAVFKGFFSALKSCDRHLKFVFITGVTKFSKVSIFSDLNQLDDISLSKDYADICGVTEEELLGTFAPEIDRLARDQGLGSEECLAELRRTYDGYRFHADAPGVYNPFSLLKCLGDRDFDWYWFATGTPTFLVRRLREQAYDVARFERGEVSATGQRLGDYRADNPDIVPLLYQTGYLTIKGYDRKGRYYTLGFPNDEVKYGFLESLMPEYAPAVASGSGKDVLSIKESLERGHLDDVRDALTALFASIPYGQDKALGEHCFQTVVYLVFTLLGQYVHSEVRSARGRADCVVETPGYVYVFEFKRDGSADEALRQIEDKGYAQPYAADPRQVYRIGVSFDSEQRGITEWKDQES